LFAQVSLKDKIDKVSELLSEKIMSIVGSTLGYATSARALFLQLVPSTPMPKPRTSNKWGFGYKSINTTDNPTLTVAQA
jgi:hypothetical protein